MRNTTPRRCRTTAAFTSYPPLPVWGHPTGICTPAVLSCITRGTTQNHIIRAAEESIAYQSADLMGAMEKDTGIKIKTLKVDGGASRDQFLMQFQADILDKVVQRPAIRETTALGAAYLAGLATGVWKSREEITHLWSCNQLFEPKMDAAQREELLEGWHKAVGRSQDWAKH